VVGAGLVGEAKLSTEVGGPEFGDQLLGSVAVVAEAALEVAVEAGIGTPEECRNARKERTPSFW
jgi:hypothetical protein